MSERMEEDLLAASREALSSGSIGPLLKKELWLKIQTRRLSEGKGELVVPATPSPSYQVTQAEKAKRLRRQEQNRRAAKKFRKKQKHRFKDVLERIEQLEESNQQLEAERLSLTGHKNHMLLQLCQHLQLCQTRPAPCLLPSARCQRLRGSDAGPPSPSSPSPSVRDVCQHPQSCRICPRYSWRLQGTPAGEEGAISSEAGREGGRTAAEGTPSVDQGRSDVLNTDSIGVSEMHAPNCRCECCGPQEEDSSLTHSNENVCANQSSVTVTGADAPAQSYQCPHLNDFSTKIPAGNKDCEQPSSSTSPHPDVSKRAGFDCGVMFLQIAGGKVSAMRGDSPLKILSVKVKDILDESETGAETTTQSPDKFPSGTKSRSPDERPEKSTSYNTAPSREDSPSCSYDIAGPETAKEQSTMLFQLHVSGTLPFCILRQTVPPAETGEETDRKQENETAAGKVVHQCAVPEPHGASVTTSGNSDVSSHTNQGQVEHQFMSPQAMTERKTSQRKRNAERHPARKCQINSEAVRESPLPMCLLSPSSAGSFAVYEDVEDGKQGDQGNNMAGTSNDNRHKSQSLKPAMQTFLRDQTNISMNQLNHNSCFSRKTCSTPKKKEEHEHVSGEGNSKKKKLHYAQRVGETSSDGLASQSSPTTKTVTLEKDSTTVQETVSLEGEDRGPHGQPAAHPSATAQTDSATAFRQITSPDAVYDSEFQHFLTNCFENLNKAEGDDCTLTSQGLIVLTSMEMPLPGVTGQHNAGSEGDDSAGSVPRVNLHSVDTLWLMDVLRESSCPDQHRDVTTDNVHPNSAGDGGEAPSDTASSNSWLFSGLKSLLLDAENSGAGTPTDLKDFPSAQGYCLLPVLSSSAARASEPGPPATCLWSPCGDEATGTATETGGAPAATTARSGPRGADCSADAPSRAPPAVGGGSGACRTLQQGTAVPSPRPPACTDLCSTADSITLSRTEYSRLVDTLLTSLAAASNTSSSG